MSFYTTNSNNTADADSTSNIGFARFGNRAVKGVG